MINKYWSGEDEGFIAICPELPGSSAFGETKQEALTELQDAIEAWIGASIKAGMPVPERQPAWQPQNEPCFCHCE